MAHTFRIAYILLEHMTVTMCSFSLACVHRACNEYIALPSACRLITVLLGHAIAAPTARGGPQPIDPPVRVKCENLGQPCRTNKCVFHINCVHWVLLHLHHIKGQQWSVLQNICKWYLHHSTNPECYMENRTIWMRSGFMPWNTA